MYVLYEDLWDPLEGLYSPCVYCHTIHPHSALLLPPSMILSETLLGNTYNEEILHTLLIQLDVTIKLQKTKKPFL